LITVFLLFPSYFSFPPPFHPNPDLASNRNEYQEKRSGGGVKGGRVVRLTVQKMWVSRCLTTLWDFAACDKDSITSQHKPQCCPKPVLSSFVGWRNETGPPTPLGHLAERISKPGSKPSVFIINTHMTDRGAGIATSYGLDDREVGVRVPVGSRIFSSPDRPDRL
jgi:hypothetical protein